MLFYPLLSLHELLLCLNFDFFIFMWNKIEKPSMRDNKLKSLNKKLENLLARFSRFFDFSIFKEKDRILAFFDHDFIKKRSIIQLLRIIVYCYIKKKNLH